MKTKCWTTARWGTSPCLVLRWCWQDTSPPTSSRITFRQVSLSLMLFQIYKCYISWKIGYTWITFSLAPLLHFRSVCDRILDLISHSHGRHPGKDGPPGHLVPGAGQHLQHSHHQHPQGWGSDCHWGLDVGLHSLCIWCSNRVRTYFFTF